MIQVSVAGLTELRLKMQQRMDRIANLEPGLLRAGAAVLKFGQQNIQSGGGSASWPPNITGTPLLMLTGRLFGSLAVGASGNVTESDNTHVTVGTNVQVGNGYNLGALMQGGTGIYGSRGTVITPTSAKALSFLVRGKRVFAKSVKGSPKRPFLYVDDAVAARVQAILGTYIGTGEAE